MIRISHQPMGSWMLGLALLSVACLFSGCIAQSRFIARSAVNSKVTLAADFSTVLYRYDDANNIELVMYRGTLDDPIEAIHIRMFWQPLAAKTAVGAQATNATIDWLVFAPDRQTGIYGGAGLLMPMPFASAGDRRYNCYMKDTTMKLLYATDRFVDPLGVCEVDGTVTAQLSPAATEAALIRLRLLARQRLGRDWQYGGVVAPPVQP